MRSLSQVPLRNEDTVMLLSGFSKATTAQRKLSFFSSWFTLFFEPNHPTGSFKANLIRLAFFFYESRIGLGQSGIIPLVFFSRRWGRIVSLKRKIKKELIGTSDYPSNKIFTISNVITFTRLILTFVFLYLFITNENRYIALIIYAIAASTDWMDGQIARMTKTVSWLGKMMDPVVDRALLFTGVLGLVGRGELPLWVCVAIIGRDAYLACGNMIVHRFHKRPIDVVYTGKIATALLMSGFTLMLLGLPVVEGPSLFGSSASAFPGLNGHEAPLGIFFVYLGVVFSLITAVVYTIKGALAIRRAQAHPEDEDVDFLNPEIDDSDEMVGSGATAGSGRVE